VYWHERFATVLDDLRVFLAALRRTILTFPVASRAVDFSDVFVGIL